MLFFYLCSIHVHVDYIPSTDRVEFPQLTCHFKIYSWAMNNA